MPCTRNDYVLVMSNSLSITDEYVMQNGKKHKQQHCRTLLCPSLTRLIASDITPKMTIPCTIITETYSCTVAPPGFWYSCAVFIDAHCLFFLTVNFFSHATFLPNGFVHNSKIEVRVWVKPPKYKTSLVVVLKA